MTILNVKVAEQDNITELAHLFDRYRQIYGQTSNLTRAINFIRARVTNRDSIILLAINSKDQIVGFCQLYPTLCSIAAAPIWIFYDLYVLPSKRRNGAAKRLLIAAEEAVKSAGATRMELATAKDNYPAQALYESLGWEIETNYFYYKKVITSNVKYL